MAPLIDRRGFIAEVCGGLAGARLFAATGPRLALALGAQSLRDRAAAKGLFYGAASGRWVLQRDPALAARVAEECGLLVSESELKWTRVHAELGRYDFDSPDRLAEFTRSHGMLFRGHVLVYYQSEPPWVTAGAPAETERVVREHIRAVVGRYAGRMQSWDVVNEILEFADHRPDGLRMTPLMRQLGPDYISLAFHEAATADPRALLCWNENQLEYAVPYQQARRDAVLKLLQGWRSAGVPIQVLGIQSHLRLHTSAFDQKGYRAFLKDVAGIGVNIIISELDVFDGDLPADPAARDKAVADAYEQYLTVALDERAVLGVVTWGLSDRSTWLSTYRLRTDGATARPLPLDADLRPKPAYYAIARALDGAPSRQSGT